MNVPESDNYLYYSDEFQYAGTLLFFVSVVMTLYVGISFVVNRKKYKRILEEEAIKKAKIDRSVEEVTLQLTKECECFTDSLCDSEQVNDVLLSYNEFCKTFVAVIQCSDEKVRMSILYESFKGIEPGAKPLLFVTGKCFYYVYPMGLVIKGKNDIIGIYLLDEIPFQYQRSRKQWKEYFLMIFNRYVSIGCIRAEMEVLT